MIVTLTLRTPLYWPEWQDMWSQTERGHWGLATSHLLELNHQNTDKIQPQSNNEGVDQWQLVAWNVQVKEHKLYDDWLPDYG